MAEKRDTGNRINVDLRLIQNQELKLMEQFAEKFASAVARLDSIGMGSYGQATAGYAGVGAMTPGGVQMGRSRPAGPAMNKSQTGHGLENYADAVEKKRKQIRDNTPAGLKFAAGLGFAPQIASQDLTARILQGNMGEMRSQDFFQYLSAMSGGYAFATDPETGDVSRSGRAGAGAAAGIHAGAGVVNMGFNVARSGSTFFRSATTSLGMNPATNAGFVQMGYSPRGFMGTQLNSTAWRRRLRAGMASKWQALSTMNWGTEQEQELRGALLGIGMNPSEGGRADHLYRDLRDISQDSGLNPDQLVSMSQYTARFEDKKGVRRLTSELSKLDEAASQAGMTTAQFAKGMEAVTQTLQQRLGMAPSKGMKIAREYTALTGVPGEAAAGVFNNDFTMMMAMSRSGKSNPSKLTATDYLGGQTALIAQAVGASSVEDLRKHVDKYLGSEQFGWLRMRNPELFQGMDEVQIKNLVVNPGRKSDAFNKLAAGISGSAGAGYSSHEIRDIGTTLLGKRKFSDFMDRDHKGFDPRDGIQKNERQAMLKAIQKALDKSDTPMVKLDLTPEARRLVKQMGYDDTSHRNKDGRSHRATVTDFLKSHADEALSAGMMMNPATAQVLPLAGAAKRLL